MDFFNKDGLSSFVQAGLVIVSLSDSPASAFFLECLGLQVCTITLD
jgi:hypothetical protein